MPSVSGFQNRRRRNIWELSKHHHCSIVGTCLSIGEARIIGKKVGVICPDPEEIDATTHSILVRESEKKNPVSVLLNKSLNKKYESSIRMFNKCKTPAEIRALWKDAMDVGNIPGPYWAALSHPQIDYEVTVKLYSDVHMLSHLVGSSNRADIARLAELEMELANVLEKNKALIVRNDKRIFKFKTELDDYRIKVRELESQNTNLKARLFIDRQSQSVGEINQEFSQGVLVSGESYPAMIGERENSKAKIIGRNLRLIDDVAKLTNEKLELQSKLESAQQQLEGLFVELQVANNFIQGLTSFNNTPTQKCNLLGKCVLYIGGRPGNICRMCDLVDKMNGRLIHHDGGKEDSLATLRGAISSADAVIFPTDCVSHSSALEAKKLCKRMAKPLLPLRSSSVSALLSGLTEIQSGVLSHALVKSKTNKL